MKLNKPHSKIQCKSPILGEVDNLVKPLTFLYNLEGVQWKTVPDKHPYQINFSVVSRKLHNEFPFPNIKLIKNEKLRKLFSLSLMCVSYKQYWPVIWKKKPWEAVHKYILDIE